MVDVSVSLFAMFWQFEALHEVQGFSSLQAQQMHFALGEPIVLIWVYYFHFFECEFIIFILWVNLLTF